jgi:hypothetical protein
MSPRFGLRLSLAVALAFAGAPALHAEEADPAQDPSALCDAAIAKGARRGGVPVEVLHAVALTETGQHRDGRMRAWPWAINREGKGFWFGTREEAMAFARASLAEGRESFDVGCVQINFRWHGHAFPSLDDMFDPEWTATYAAQFLRNLYEERGSWSEAAGAYHSLTPERAQIYRERFDRLLAGLDPGALTEAEALVASAVPGFASGGRNARRAAERQAMVDRIRLARAEPPPAAVMGSVGAGHMIAPANGSLVVQGTTLLTEGHALLVAPSGSLF